MKKENKNKNGLSAKTLGSASAIVVSIISILLFVSLFLLSNKFNDVQTSTNNYMKWKESALTVRETSDYLTDQVRCYVFTHNKDHMDYYFEEVNVTKRRDEALKVMEEFLPNSKAYEDIDLAVTRSNELMLKEYHAMRLVVASDNITMDDTYEQVIRDWKLTEEELAMTSDELDNLALKEVIGNDYLADKQYIIDHVNSAASAIDTMMEKDIISSTSSLKRILIWQQILIAINIIVIILIIIVLYRYMFKPLNRSIDSLKNRKDMQIEGLKEYRYLANVYNDVRKQSENIKEKLLFEAEHDQLTGLYNRTGYDAIYRRAKLDRCYYILIDVDFFKKVNDVHGHEVGDKVLVKVATMISKTFNQDNEFIFRLGGDEFSILVEHNDDIKIEDLIKKCEAITDRINHEGKKIPEITLSIGIAKGDENDTTDTLFKKADTALYSAKNNGRHNITVYQKK